MRSGVGTRSTQAAAVAGSAPARGAKHAHPGGVNRCCQVGGCIPQGAALAFLWQGTNARSPRDQSIIPGPPKSPAYP